MKREDQKRIIYGMVLINISIFLTVFSLPARGPFLGRLEMTWITFKHAISIGKVGIPPW